MALETLSGIASALTQVFAPELDRQFNQEAVTAKALTFEDGRGKNVAWDVEFSGASAAAYAEGSDVTDGEMLTNPAVPAVLDWGRYRSAFKISGDAIDAAMSTVDGATALVDLVRERVLNCGTALSSVINTDLITGTGTDGAGNPTIIGFLGGALATTGSYAGIYRTGGGTNYTEWKGNALANGAVARPLTLDLMAQGEQLIFTASNMKPTIILTSPGVVRKYKGLFEPIHRVSGIEPRVDSLYGAEFTFMGIPVVRDRNFTAGTLVMANQNLCKVRQLPQGLYPDTNATDGQLPDTNGAQTGITPIRFRIYPLAKTGDSVKFVLQAKLQLQVRRPNAFCVISDISES